MPVLVRTLGMTFRLVDALKGENSPCRIDIDWLEMYIADDAL